MIPVITIRPAPGDAATVERGAHQGLTVTSHPLFTVGPVPWDIPDPAAHDAVLIGSANALRHGGAGLTALTTLPALCVGETTAQAAREAGFDVIATGARGMQTLLPHAEARGLHRLLRLSGEAHVPLDVPHGVSVDTCILYAVHAAPMDEALIETLAAGALVLLHSGEAAEHFAHECDRNGIPRSQIMLACLAPRIAQRAGIGWASCRSAPAPQDAALLALAEQMCQGCDPSQQ
ncbi:uroporphyrinogen-III synthase [Croceicoccus mobilis]|uniref:Tetrapyrrole biosynthesis uroporphyrinogen III synthase domain-containing protein n=1 Tax=Croceicoccus mobilis TaxID=1703339 RepID=A0A916YX04_9SPHN|nr:uroporphyrinogen-III synthase [Croceicoccus mobilis]GGD65290.1 hypothetical protein GCM10010990_13490 [Croceicoccus mobilis]